MDGKLNRLKTRLDAVLAERKLLDPDLLLTARFRGQGYEGMSDVEWRDLVLRINTDLDFNAPEVAALTMESDSLQAQIADTALQAAADRVRSEAGEQEIAA